MQKGGQRLRDDREGPMTTRRRAREIVVQLLFEEDLNPIRDEIQADEFLKSRLLRNKPLVAFARQLWHGVVEHRKSIDQFISPHASNWSIKRMASIDRNVLRLATYEMLYEQLPGSVAINEAIELAKRYGDRNSGQFVNGVLDRVFRAIESNDSTEKMDRQDDSELNEDTPSANAQDKQVEAVATVSDSEE